MRVCFLIIAVLLTACGPGGNMGPGDAGDTVSCVGASGVDTWSPGMSHQSSNGRLVATIVAGDPSPPARGNNSWTLKLTDSTGAALSPTAVPFMPEHGHGTSVVPDVTPMSDGTYQVTPLYLFMPGIWRVTLAPSADAGTADSAVFVFCIEG